MLLLITAIFAVTGVTVRIAIVLVLFSGFSQGTLPALDHFFLRWSAKVCLLQIVLPPLLQRIITIITPTRGILVFSNNTLSKISLPVVNQVRSRVGGYL